MVSATSPFSNGLDLPAVPQMLAAKIRLFGPQAAAIPVDPGPTADDVIAEFGVGAEGELPTDAEKAQKQAEKERKLEEDKKLTLTQERDREDVDTQRSSSPPRATKRCGAC